ERGAGPPAAGAPIAYPKTYNIQMDPHEDLMVAGLYGWVAGPALKEVERAIPRDRPEYPNPPASNITQFTRHGGERVDPLMRMLKPSPRRACLGSCGGAACEARARPTMV